MADFIYPTVTRITSNYGSRTHPITGKKDVSHPGTDFAQAGTHIIKASASGTVSRSYRSTSYGETVFLLHNIRGVQYETVYAHMRAGSRRVSVGQRVNQGQAIGTMGSTGNSTGQHLHFEIHKGRWNLAKSNSINPLSKLKAIPNKPDPKVKQLQQDLKKLGYSVGNADGFSGAKTTAGIKAFQETYNLEVDGKAGKVTIAKINEILKGGLTMSEAKKLQKQIDELKAIINKPKSINPSESHRLDWDRLKAEGITDGSDPRGNLTREQAASLIYRYKESTERDSKLIHDYAEEAIEWAIENGISTGDLPNDYGVRQQVITMIYNYEKYRQLNK